MLDETKEVEFENPICSQIVSTYRKDYSNSNILTSLHFTSHQNADVQKYAIDLVANKYTLDSWEKQDVYVPTDEEKLDSMAYKCILYLKSVKITNEIEKIAGKISATQDFEEIMNLMLKSKLLKDKAVRLSKELGTVVQG